MNAEQMELARRFVACKGWGGIAGMQFSLMVGDTPVECGRIAFDGDDPWESIFAKTFYGRNAMKGAYCVLPDLSDALTRAGMLEVVRRAWRDETACLRWACRDPFAALWVWEAGEGLDRQTGWAESELAALLAALEAAPGV